MTDACDAEVSIRDVVISSVSSDEPENGEDDGNTIDDIDIAEDCQSVDLRAERGGSGNGRVYTINLAVKDARGNTGLASLQMYVPQE